MDYSYGDVLGMVRTGERIVASSVSNRSISDQVGMELIRGADSGDIARVRSAIGQGACLNQKTNTEETALIIAARKGHLEILRFLLEAGADPNRCDVLGNTALIHSARLGSVVAVSELLRHGGRADHFNEEMQGAACAARRSGHEELASMIESHK